MIAILQLARFVLSGSAKLNLTVYSSNATTPLNSSVLPFEYSLYPAKSLTTDPYLPV